MKKKLGLLLLSVLVLFAFGCASSPIEQPDVEHHVVILHTNDHHGHPVAFYDYPAPGQGGLPARAAFVEQVRSDNPNVLVLDAGDINTGRPESNFFKAEPDILGYNYIGYDAMAMGNHEFDPSPEVMQEQIALAEFPWLCANVVMNDGSIIENVEPYIIKEYEGFKVAILGLMDEGTAETGNPENIGDLTFLDPVETALEYVPMLKEQADIVVALVHMGIYDSVDEGSKRLAANVPGIAHIVDGHSHTLTEEVVYVENVETGVKVGITQAKHWGLYMGKVDLSFMNGEVTGIDFEAVPINLKTREKLEDGTSVYNFVGKELVDDKTLLDTLTPYVEKVDAVLSEEIGVATAPFLNDNTRKMETAIGDAVADSMLWYVEAMGMDVDFAFQNGGGVRTSMAEGPIQKQTIYEVLPFDNSVALVTLTGAQLLELLARVPETVGHGAMPQVSEGISFTIDMANGKVTDVLVGGKPVDKAKEYRIATNSYLAAGGDGYAIFKSGSDYYDTSLMQRDAFIEYIIGMGGSLTPEVKGRITIK